MLSPAISERATEALRPVLLAEEYEHGLKAWCPFCCKFHFHGIGEGHRVAHCIEPDSPFQKGGYVLILASDAKAIGREHAKRTRRRRRY